LKEITMSGVVRTALMMVVPVALCGGCSSSSSSPTATATPGSAALRETSAIPADSPLAKVRVDMGQREVTDLIGPPTDVDSHITGKAFVPFYFGDDAHRMVHHYKG
jgi:hypothetical protein